MQNIFHFRPSLDTIAVTCNITSLNGTVKMYICYVYLTLVVNMIGNIAWLLDLCLSVNKIQSCECANKIGFVFSLHVTFKTFMKYEFS